MWKYRFLGLLTYCFSVVLFWSLRIRYVGMVPDWGNVYGLYHQQFFMIMFWFKAVKRLNVGGKKIACLVSNHRDGEILNTVLGLIGMDNIRGDTRHEAVAGLKGIVKKQKQGHSTIFALDGPAGPFKHIYPGAVAAAKLGRKPINVLFAAAEKAWHFKSWDKFFLPKPFSRAKVMVTEDFYVNPDLNVEENLEAFRKFVQDREAEFGKIGFRNNP